METMDFNPNQYRCVEKTKNKSCYKSLRYLFNKIPNMARFDDPD